MSKTILYFHGFASSSNSNKAKFLKKYISKNYKNTEIIIPDLDNNFTLAVSQIHTLIDNAKYPIVFIGSSLALISSSLVGVLIGKWLSNRVSPGKFAFFTGLLMIIISIFLAYEIIKPYL